MQIWLKKSTTNFNLMKNFKALCFHRQSWSVQMFIVRIKTISMPWIHSLSIFLKKMQNATEISLPSLSNCRKKVRKKTRPGWNEEIKPFRDNAYFWHQIWSSCGRPLNNEVHKIMKKTWNVYHFQFRKCIKAEEKNNKEYTFKCLFRGKRGSFRAD